MPSAKRRAPYRRSIALAASIVAGFCGSPNIVANEASPTGDELLIVDCLLPGQLRQLGRRATYVSARRAIRTSARNCQIRGGEYVAYDRADYRTALNVWLPLAKDGDDSAQVLVGEIYEKGLGIPPDYKIAAEWYRIAADANNTRAQINLAYLYEKGLGVPRDTKQAYEWYRRASGNSSQVVLEVTASADLETVNTLTKQAEGLRAEAAKLRAELNSARQQLESIEREEPVTLQTEPGTGTEKPEESLTAQSDLTATVESLQAEIQRRAKEFQELETLLATTRIAVETSQAELAKSREALQASQREFLASQEQMTQQDADAIELIQQTAEREQTLATLAQELTEREHHLESKRDQLQDLQAQVTELDTLANQRRDELAGLEVNKAEMQAAVYEGPEIALIEPQLDSTRGISIVATTPAGTARSVIGRVTAPVGLISLTVNGHKTEANAMGVFTRDVDVGREPRPVEIIAVDNQGKRDQLSFVLHPILADLAPIERAPEEGAPAKLPDVDFGSFHALVVGNNNYDNLPNLRTAKNDARQLSTLLADRYGFQVRTLLDANRYEILSALNDYRETLTSKDNLLVYYAGHGDLDRVNNRGHWLPRDAEMDSTANWISNIAITDILNAMQAKQILVIADSCYSGSLTRSSVGQLETGLTEQERINWLRTMAEKRSRTVMTSGGLSPVLDSGGGDNSVFGKALLDVLAANGDLIDGRSLYREVSARVAYASANVNFDQVPEYAPIRFAGHEAGDFFFVPSL